MAKKFIQVDPLYRREVEVSGSEEEPLLDPAAANIIELMQYWINKTCSSVNETFLKMSNDRHSKGR